jgi:V8-like Glu-specific endopeptidase
MPAARVRFASLCLAALGFAATGCAGEIDDGPTGESEDAIIGGVETFERPEVGIVARWGTHMCTGTLIRPNVVITAAHCFSGTADVSQAPAKFSFVVQKSKTEQHSFEVDYVYSLLFPQHYGKSDWRDHDIALLRLKQNVPASVTRPLEFARSWPWPGTRIGIFGYGCTSWNASENKGSGTKRKKEMSWTLGRTLGLSGSEALCAGDSGGPLIDYTKNMVVGINSGGATGAKDTFGSIPEDYWLIMAKANEWRR